MSALVSTHYADGRQVCITTDFGSEDTAASYISNMRQHSFADHFFVTTPDYKVKVRSKPLPKTPPVAKTPQELQDGMPF